MPFPIPTVPGNRRFCLFPRNCLRPVVWAGALLLTLAARAQHYPTRTYTLRDGLPQMQVTCLLADSRGYLWVGTKFGLAKFDGERFESFTRSDYGLPTYSINGLAEDRHHRVWISTSRGLARFDGGRFEAFPFDSTLLPVVSPIQVGDGDVIWFSSNESHSVPHELFCLRDGKYRRVREFIRGLDSLFVHQVRWDRQRACLWLTAGTRARPLNTALYRISGGQCRQVTASRPRGTFRPSLVESVGTLLVREDNEAGGYNFLRFGPGSSLVPFLEIRGDGVRVVSAAPFDFYEMVNGFVVKVAAGSTRVERILDSRGNLSTNGPTRLGDKVFFPTEKGLLEVLDNGLRYFDETQAPYAWSVAERPNGEVWWLNFGSPPRRFSTNGDGPGTVSLLDEPGLRQLLARERPLQAEQWNSYYYHPAHDRRGTLYLPHTLGLIAYDGRTWRFLTRAEDGVPFYVCHDARTADRVLVGINGGFFVFEGGQLRRKLTKAGGLHESPFGLCALADAEPDVYWLGSGGGLSRYRYREGRFEHFTEANGKLPMRGVIDLCLDKWGSVWMVGPDGVGRYDRRTGRIERIAAEQFKSVFGFVGLLDDQTLAIGDAHGVYLLDLPTYYRTGRVAMRLLNHRTGFVGIEAGQAGFFKDRQGRAWMTTSTSLVVLDTRRFRFQPQALQPVVRTLNGQRLPFADSVFTLTGPQEKARVGFEAIGDNRPARTQWAWRLDGGPWSDWQEEPFAVLRDYGGGIHRFDLRARNGGLNEAAERVVSLHFRADIPWYDAPALRRNLPNVLWALLVLVGVVLWQAASDRRQARRARRELEQRAREALFLNVQTLQSQLNTHFLFNVLVPLQNLILQNRGEEAARLLVEFSNLVREFLNSSALSNGTTYSLIEREITLADEISLLRRYVSFEQLLYRDKLTVHFGDESLGGNINPETVTLPPMLIQPYVENAIKHGLVHKPGPGNLWIRFVEVDETLVCTIEDDGIGREGMKQIHQTSLRAYKSLGSDLVQKRVDALNQLGYAIRIRTDDRLAGGTVVTLTIARTDA